MIKKLWARFDGMDVECVCEPHIRNARRCRDKKCQEFVVSFVEIDRENEEVLRNLNKSTRVLDNSVRKFQSEIVKSIQKMKKVKV